MGLREAVGPAGEEILREYMRQNPGLQVSPLWQPIGRRRALVSGGQVDLSFRPKGSDYIALAVSAHFGAASALDNPLMVGIEMRGASRSGYILGDETQPLPLAALTQNHAPLPLTPGRILTQDEDYTVTAFADTLNGACLVGLTFWGFYVRPVRG